MVKNICERLKFSNERKRRVLAIQSVKEMPKTKSELKLLISELGMGCVADFLEYKKAFSVDVGTIEEFLREIKEKKECYSLKQLALNGRDLISLGITDGAEIGKLLSKLLVLVIFEKVENDRDALISYLSSLNI